MNPHNIEFFILKSSGTSLNDSRSVALFSLEHAGIDEVVHVDCLLIGVVIPFGIAGLLFVVVQFHLLHLFGGVLRPLHSVVRVHPTVLSVALSRLDDLLDGLVALVHHVATSLVAGDVLGYEELE